MEKVPRKHSIHRNKHHLLYPERAWRRLGPIGEMLRGSFIIKINRNVHKELHDEIDKTLGGYVWSDKLPRKCTLLYLKKEYQRQERTINKMKPIDKIKWLEERLSYDDAHSHWLKTMLRRQREFLENHYEEL